MEDFMKPSKAKGTDKFEADKKAFSNVVEFMERHGCQKTASRGVSRDSEKSSRFKSKKLGNVISFDVWSVDGEAIRNQIDIDFVAGGNPGRYNYVPMGEIWIESNIARKGIAPVIVHEIVECIFMQVGGMTYSRAHDMACVIESGMRRLMTCGKLKGGSPASMASKFLGLLK
jgi:hypothetical protein